MLQSVTQMQSKIKETSRSVSILVEDYSRMEEIMKELIMIAPLIRCAIVPLESYDIISKFDNLIIKANKVLEI